MPQQENGWRRLSNRIHSYTSELIAPRPPNPGRIAPEREPGCPLRSRFESCLLAGTAWNEDEFSPPRKPEVPVQRAPS